MTGKRQREVLEYVNGNGATVSIKDLATKLNLSYGVTYNSVKRLAAKGSLSLREGQVSATTSAT